MRNLNKIFCCNKYHNGGRFQIEQCYWPIFTLTVPFVTLSSILPSRNKSCYKYNYTPGQNIWIFVKNLVKRGRARKLWYLLLISTAIAKVWFMEGRLGTRLCLHSNLGCLYFFFFSGNSVLPIGKNAVGLSLKLFGKLCAVSCSRYQVSP